MNQTSEEAPGAPPPPPPAAPISFSIKPRKETVKKSAPIISKTTQVLGDVDSDEDAPEEEKKGLTVLW